MITVFVHQAGRTERAEAVDPRWLEPDTQARVWVDLFQPTADESRILTDVFHFHPLSVEDALSTLHHPKIESYDGYLYLILHGIDFQAAEHRFETQDTDFFVSPRYLVTIHGHESRSLSHVQELCERHAAILAEGTVALLHRIVDQMVDHYAPEVDELEERMDEIEQDIFDRPDRRLARDILDLKRDVASLRRITIPQRDAVARLARREFPLIDVEMAYRFRDVYDQLVRLSDEATMFQDRITGILDAHLSSVSNQLNQVMKVLTVITTIFGAWTVISGIFGMNVPPFTDWRNNDTWMPLVGVVVGMFVVAGVMILWFRRKGWF